MQRKRYWSDPIAYHRLSITKHIMQNIQSSERNCSACAEYQTNKVSATCPKHVKNMEYCNCEQLQLESGEDYCAYCDKQIDPLTLDYREDQAIDAEIDRMRDEHYTRDTHKGI